MQAVAGAPGTSSAGPSCASSMDILSVAGQKEDLRDIYQNRYMHVYIRMQICVYRYNIRILYIFISICILAVSVGVVLTYSQSPTSWGLHSLGPLILGNPLCIQRERERERDR